MVCVKQLIYLPKDASLCWGRERKRLCHAGGVGQAVLDMERRRGASGQVTEQCLHGHIPLLSPLVPGPDCVGRGVGEHMQPSFHAVQRPAVWGPSEEQGWLGKKYLLYPGSRKLCPENV